MPRLPFLAVAAIALPVASGGAHGQLFSTPRYTVGPSPYSIASGDLNGDGKPDLVAANYGGSSLSVLLTTAGVPTSPNGYAAAATYPVGAGSYMAAVADADNDGKLDLVAACYTSDFLAFLKGDGAGGFGSVVALFPGNGPAGVAVTDFNGDGLKDVLSANFDDSTVALLKGNGSGGFLPPITQTTSFHPNHVTTLDLNADAKPDVVTAGYGTQNIAVLLNNGAGGLGLWTGYSAGDAPFSLATGDIDGDGDLDLASSAAVSNQVWVFKNVGTGAPQPFQTFAMPSAPTGLAFADVNGNGMNDLLVAMQGTAPLWLGQIRVFDGGPSGLGFSQDLMSGTAGTDVIGVDLDLDGDVDVAATNSGSNDVVVHPNLGGGVLTMPPARTKWTPFWFYPTDLQAGDLDGDGTLDLAVASNFAHTRFSTLRGHGDGLFDEPAYVEVFSEQGGIALGDLSGNHTLDVAVSAMGSSSIVTKLGDGAGGFGSTFTYAGGGGQVRRMAMGDLSGDGKPDLLVGHGVTPGLSIHWGNGIGGFSDPPATLSSSAASVDVRIEDMDGNGWPDLVNSTGTTLMCWRGVGAAQFAPPGTSQAMPATGRLAIGDLTADGVLDAVTASTNGNLYVVSGNLNFVWNAPFAVGVAASGVLVPKLADLDANGVLDLVVGDSASGPTPIGLHVLLGNGFGGFGPPTRFLFQNSPQAISIADVDADGRPDVLMACQNILANNWTELVVMRNVLGAPQGVASFGSGTPGAYGRLGLTASSAAKVGNSGFALECTNAPRTSLGIAFLGNVASVAGADPFGLGLSLHVDLLASTLLLLLDMPSDLEGIGRVLAPIPNVPGLAGATLQAQALWVEKASSGQLTSDAALGLVSSKGMSFTIVP